ncbi:hypothetical protein EJ04DRAFT_570532 [Polyplosphaeria fusca]|uniref:Uncharacterized protein n=1 Tax=Polyplosphaeria fusca TaxID=682080 RepID=A0A9P4QH96_9PLEO|nr:hypothetical protein EJ04DRAFT_570532 [Polyplosphaeria fusca]
MLIRAPRVTTRRGTLVFLILTTGVLIWSYYRIHQEKGSARGSGTPSESWVDMEPKKKARRRSVWHNRKNNIKKEVYGVNREKKLAILTRLYVMLGDDIKKG